jgi:predicted membrane-bound spermidine synthase
MRTPALYITSILCGFALMALEILASRLIQPVFGSSVDVWAAIITVFILSLSVGYVIGGRIADHARTNLPLGWVVLGSGVLFLLMTIYGLRVNEQFPESIQTARWGSLLSSLVLFLPPSILLGCVSPMLVKLVFVSAERVGRTTGTLYAVGSIGNVLGILVANYVFLPLFPLNPTIIALGAVLVVIGLIHICIRVEAAPVNAAATGVSTSAASPA